MVQSKFRIKAVGLCILVAASFTVLSASMAQAETGAKWFFNGAQLAEGLKPPVQGSLVGNHGTLLTTLGGKVIHLLCTGRELVLTNIFEKNGQILGHSRLTGCKFLELVTPGGATKVLAPCEPFEGAEKGVILTNLVKGLVTLHTGAGLKDTVRLEPHTAGGVFANINLGEECAFGEKINVGGTLTLQDATSDAEFLKELVTHVVEEHKVLKGIWINSTTNPAHIVGKVNMSLSGVGHAGRTWSAKPN